MKRSRIVRPAFLALASLLASAPASAGPIFDVNRTVGTGSVTGTIETDGTVGTIDATNIVSFMLNISDGIDNFTISSGTGGMLLIDGMNYLMATANALTFNFGGDTPGGAAFAEGDDANGGGWGFVNGANPGPCTDCELIFHVFTDIESSGTHEQFANFSGVLQFALAQPNGSTAPPDAEMPSPDGSDPTVGIPEPGTLGLLGLGLALIVLARRRKTS